MNKARIKTNTIATAANITYYGGTLSAGIGFHHLLNNSPLAIAALIVFVLVVEGLLRTLIDEVLDAATDHNTGDTAAVPAKTEQATR